ncbi:MAG: histidinol-phosphatase [Planctomycetaceae bacterium]
MADTDVEHLWKFTLQDAPLDVLLEVLDGFFGSHFDKIAHVHLPGYFPSEEEHRPMSSSPVAVRSVLSLLADYGFSGLVVSEADPEYQTLEGLREDVDFFHEWQRFEQAMDHVSIPVVTSEEVHQEITIEEGQALLYESHCHTPLCKHATGDPEEYAAVAEERGLKGLIVTCHNPLPDGHSADVRMSINEFPYYIGLVERAAETWAGRIDVRLGLEADYLPGYEAWLADQLGWADFHFVLGSVHPQTAEYRAVFADPNPFEAQRTYFRLLARAAETGLFDSLSHPDLIKNETVGLCRPQDIMDDVRRALDRIAETGVAMELNTSGLNKRVSEMNPSVDLLVEMQQRGIPGTLGADAHEPGRVADHFVEALSMLNDCGYQHLSLFLNRERFTIPIPAALASLTKPQVPSR